MGFFSNLFRPQQQLATTLVEAIERLQMALLTKLTIHYSARFPPTEALSLANCVLTYAMLVEPTSDDAKKYYQAHRQFVCDQAAQLSANADVAEAFSYLFAALTIHIAIQTRSPVSEPAAQLCTRATELSMYVPNTYDICGTGDAGECIAAISVFSQNYMRDARAGPTRT